MESEGGPETGGAACYEPGGIGGGGKVVWEGGWGCVCHLQELGIRLGVDGLGLVEGEGGIGYI